MEQVFEIEEEARESFRPVDDALQGYIDGGFSPLNSRATRITQDCNHTERSSLHRHVYPSTLCCVYAPTTGQNFERECSLRLRLPALCVEALQSETPIP